MQRRPEPKQSNAARLNYAQIKEQEQLNKQRLQNEEFKTDQKQALIQRQRAQYDHVTSNGYGVAGSKQPQAQGTDDVEIRVFVRECDPDAQTFAFRESEVCTPLTKGPAADAAPRGQPGAVRFGRRASAEDRRKPQEPTAERSTARGEVPAYLLKRKNEMQSEKDAIQAEIARQQEVSQYPPGHRPVTEPERVAILEKLAQRKKELENEIGRLPMRFDTMAVKQKRQQLEAEMAEVESAQQKFSVKKQLFVPI